MRQAQRSLRRTVPGLTKRRGAANMKASDQAVLAHHKTATPWGAENGSWVMEQFSGDDLWRSRSTVDDAL
jgi:hypothetical protein